jgi:hypothetical protein
LTAAQPALPGHDATLYGEALVHHVHGPNFLVRISPDPPA